MNEKINIVIADDHAHFRRGLAATINESPRMKVVAEASNAEELVTAAELHSPDVIVTDLVMPGSGITAIRRLTSVGFNRIIVLTGFEEEDMIVEALEAGALGYVAKIAEPEEIIDAILQVYKFRSHYSDSSSSVLIKEMVESSYNPFNKIPIDFDEKEVEIIRLTVLGASISEIAAKVFMSERKVSRLKGEIRERAQVSGRNGLLFYALKAGIVTRSDFP